MKIDRHNYEEYFILYVDNELPANERLMVEEFASLNADLKEELELLLQSKLTPDQHIIFEGKEELMMSYGLPSISLSNYEKWLVLYVDDELSPAERNAVDQFVLLHPNIRNELKLFHKTKIAPEQIVFPHKQDLYRKEVAGSKPTRRIVYWRWTAAAVLILLAGISGLVLINNNTDTGGPLAVKSEPPIIQSKTKKQKNNISESTATTEVVATQDAIKNDPPQVKEFPGKNGNGEPGSGKVGQSPQKATMASNKNREQPSNNLAKPDENPYVNPDFKNKNVIASIDLPSKTELTGSPETNTMLPVTKDPLEPSFVSRPIATNNEMDEEGPGTKKTRFRGLLRKVTRNLEKRANIDATDDDDRLLVGGLAFRL